MRPAFVGHKRTPLVIGLSYGLIAGVGGIAQWILTEQDLASRVAQFHETQSRYPGFFDSTNVVRGNEWFWISTALQASAGALVVYTLAAFTASWLSRRYQDGVFAAWIAAAVGGALYTIAAILVAVLGPDRVTTESVGPCVIIYASALAGILYPFAKFGADLGVRRREASLRSRRTSLKL